MLGAAFLHPSEAEGSGIASAAGFQALLCSCYQLCGIQPGIWARSIPQLPPSLPVTPSPDAGCHPAAHGLCHAAPAAPCKQGGWEPPLSSLAKMWVMWVTVPSSRPECTKAAAVLLLLRHW